MAVKPKKTVVDEMDEPAQGGDQKPVYTEWDCEVKFKTENGKTVPYAEKLKISRPKVVITEQEAETLNDGLLTGGNKYVKMYFLAE